MIKAKQINKSYDGLQVLKDVSLEVKESEIVSITGPSGAGKSTLIQIMGTLERPSSGEVLYNDENVSAYNDKKLAIFRNTSIGFIFQFHHLLPEFTAVENVCMPAFIAGKNKSSAETEAKRLLEILGLQHRYDHKPGELSGGEQQRVAIARALINQPQVVYADEPSGNLDSENAEELHQLFLSLRDEFKQTFVIVTHNAELAAIADRTVKMKDGRIIS
ncbi:ABC transporter ATP-binding protein [bacterium]|jgi:lipoprotein-releasing system ATP-binding protein|nr:ABC transporter ATP-binding protein [bacterium]